MTQYTHTAYIHKPDKKPIPPQDRHIPSSNCCGRCVYNIPQGTLMLVLPGLGTLIIGIVIMSWTSVDDAWHGGITQAGMILVVLGGVLFIGGVLYWIYMWCKLKPKSPSKRAVSPHPRPKTKEPVALVGVYRLRHDGSSIPVDIGSPVPGTSISTIS